MTTSIGKRARPLNERSYVSGPIVYWMNRDQRVRDNWALLAAEAWAKKNEVPLVIAHNLVPNFLEGGARSWDFKVRGLKEVEEVLHEHGIRFHLFVGEKSHQDMTAWIKNIGAGGLVTDFSPLRLAQAWTQHVLHALDIPIHQVDTHNIVPCWIASQKQEFAARTLRPKIQAHLKEYLVDIPRLSKQTHRPSFKTPTIDWSALHALVPAEKGAGSTDWIKPGEKEALKALRRFIAQRLEGYSTRRNDPSAEGVSDLSPYFHYGHLSPGRAAWEVQEASAPRVDKDAYLEELIVRRELADNFCFYQPKYDSFDGLPAWAQKSLNEHRQDARPYLYTRKQFEEAKTHDTLWNAAQRQMMMSGKMHGYMRMYWAKKILEWTKNPEEAFRIAISLNDRYELDGRDPNGYVGIAWSIGGLHDRPWFKHPVFGAIRYMSRGGCEKKFDVEAYIQRWSS